MLRTINQGLVLNAIMESGFGCTYDHFDIARFVKNDSQGNTARLEVTSQHLQEAPPADEPPRLDDNWLDKTLKEPAEPQPR